MRSHLQELVLRKLLGRQLRIHLPVIHSLTIVIPCVEHYPIMCNTTPMCYADVQEPTQPPLSGNTSLSGSEFQTEMIAMLACCTHVPQYYNTTNSRNYCACWQHKHPEFESVCSPEENRTRSTRIEHTFFRREHILRYSINHR